MLGGTFVCRYFLPLEVLLQCWNTLRADSTHPNNPDSQKVSVVIAVYCRSGQAVLCRTEPTE